MPKRFEEMHVEEQAQLALEMLRMVFEANQPTIEKFAAACGVCPIEIWRQVCAECGFDECEPWEGYPAPPKRENWQHAPGANQPLPWHYEKLVAQAKVFAGKDKH
jgi:hypothetical protein